MADESDRNVSALPLWLRVVLDTVEPDRPEPPPPVHEGEDVTPRLMDWIDTIVERIDPDLAQTTWDLVARRAVYGWRKYGTTFRTGNGRDVLHDTEQEIGDPLQYIFSARMQGIDVDAIRRFLPVLEKLLSREWSVPSRACPFCGRSSCCVRESPEDDTIDPDPEPII